MNFEKVIKREFNRSITCLTNSFKGMQAIKNSLLLLGLFSLSGCVGNMSPTGGNSNPNYPYFITTEPLVVKKILIPKGTKLVYEKYFFREGEQSKIMNEEKLTGIQLQHGATINWAGVPVTSIDKFFNSEMSGYTVAADFEKLSNDKKTKFSELWQNCSNDLGITVKNTDDWSFNPTNIADVESCSVNYQRYFKENKEQQNYLNSMYAALMKIPSK